MLVFRGKRSEESCLPCREAGDWKRGWEQSGGMPLRTRGARKGKVARAARGMSTTRISRGERGGVKWVPAGVEGAWQAGTEALCV